MEENSELQRFRNEREQLRQVWGKTSPSLGWRFAQWRKTRTERRREVSAALKLTRSVAGENAPADPRVIDTLVRMYEENTEQGRHTESERSTVTTFVLAGSATITAFVASKDFSHNFWPLAFFIPLLGLYGLVTAMKLYERYDFHMKRARAFRRRVEAALPLARITTLRSASGIEQWKEYPLREGFRLHWLWLGLNSVIFVAGLALAIYVSLPRP